MEINFEGKSVLVTGHSRGIGKCISDKFTELGAKVIGISSEEYDLMDRMHLGGYITELFHIHHFDIVVNNAGMNKINLTSDVRVSDFMDVMHVNLVAPFIISQFAALFMKQKGGHIINMASIFGTITKEKRLAYTASKHALIGMTKTMGIELARHGVFVNSISCGFVKTDLTTQILGKEGIEAIEKEIPIGRLAEPEEIANVVMLLCSKYNTYMAGQNIIIDGGFVNV